MIWDTFIPLGIIQSLPVTHLSLNQRFSLLLPPQLGLKTPFYFEGSWNVCNLCLFVVFEKPMWSSVYKIIIKCICDRFLSFSILPLLENSGDNHMTTCILNINVDYSVSCARSLYFVILDALISLINRYSFIWKAFVRYMEYHEKIRHISRRYTVKNIIIDIVFIVKDVIYIGRNNFCFPGWFENHR